MNEAMKKPPPTTKTIHEIDKNGDLFFLLNGLNGALNKIGDALMRGGANNEQLNRIEKKVDRLVVSIETDPETLKQLQEKLGSITDTLKSAVENQQPK